MYKEPMSPDSKVALRLYARLMESATTKTLTDFSEKNI